ncbi:MAG TPA: hypothetical protein PLN95_00360 [Candidatus Saccharibacteria bacterium]|nr:hypothetical protein [Candidatus Saccharibacteria bacterium]
MRELNKKMNSFKSTVIAALAILFAVVAILPAPSVDAKSAALSIVPKKTYTIEPGKSVNDKLTIRNLDNAESLELTLRVVDFTFLDDGGTPKLMLANDAPRTTWSLKPFLKIPEQVTIPPKGSKTLDMNVSIPSYQGAGSFYSAIVYSSGAPEGGNVGLSASGVTLVFTSVPGEVDEELKLEKFGSYDVKSRKFTYFNTQEPQNIAFTLKNNGNVVEAPVGTITLRDMFGHERVIDNVNPNQSLALIGQSRTFTSCIKLKAEDVDFNGARSKTRTCVNGGLWPGYYRATLNLFYGQNGNNTEEITSVSGFWYLPIWFIILVIVLLLVIAYYVRKAVLFVQTKTGRRTKIKRPSRRT